MSKIDLRNASWNFSMFFPGPNWVKITQNSISMRFPVQTSKNLPKTTKTPPVIGLGAKSWKAPHPPPAKADIATAILTCHWAFSVADCPPISTPWPPKRCGRICRRERMSFSQFQDLRSLGVSVLESATEFYANSNDLPSHLIRANSLHAFTSNILQLHDHGQLLTSGDQWGTAISLLFSMSSKRLPVDSSHFNSILGALQRILKTFFLPETSS